MAGGFMLIALGGGLPALAQTSGGLRGAMDDGPMARVGRTAGDATPAGAIQRGDTLAAGRPRSGPPRAVRTATGRTRNLPRRPAQQDFRSLEKPLNTAVPAPAGRDLTYQGLPPVIEGRRRRAIDANPYDPVGLRPGGFIVFPTLDLGIGYDDNALRRTAPARKQGSMFYSANAGLRAQSDWSRHELTADLRGGYTWFAGVDNADRPTGQGRIGLRLDATRDTAVNMELRGSIDTESPGSPNLSDRVVNRPVTYQTGASLGVTQRWNRFLVSGTVLVDRADYADGKLSNGSSFSQQDRNYTQYAARGRMAYEVTPGLVPFAEVQVDTRRYDQNLNSGFRRSSDGVSGRAGTSFEITRTLVGEISAGYGIRRFDDPRLTELRGPIVDGALTWIVSPLTTLRLRGVTQFEETTIADAAGGLTRRISAELTHAFLRNLVFNAQASFSVTDFQGISRKDDTFRAGMGLDYSLTRNLVARASVTHERTTSNAPGNNLSANVFLFGLRLQY
jgi:hypothetical protein